jgi:hypothetical protein
VVELHGGLACGQHDGLPRFLDAGVGGLGADKGTIDRVKLRSDGRMMLFRWSRIGCIRILWVAAVPSYHAGRNHLAALNLSRYGVA